MIGQVSSVEVCDLDWCLAQVKPLSCRWEDVDTLVETKARLAARDYEQCFNGDEQFYSATLSAGTLRTLLAVAFVLGLSVSIGDCTRRRFGRPGEAVCHVMCSSSEVAAAVERVSGVLCLSGTNVDLW